MLPLKVICQAWCVWCNSARTANDTTAPPPTSPTTQKTPNNFPLILMHLHLFRTINVISECPLPGCQIGPERLLWIAQHFIMIRSKLPCPMCDKWCLLVTHSREGTLSLKPDWSPLRWKNSVRKNIITHSWILMPSINLYKPLQHDLHQRKTYPCWSEQNYSSVFKMFRKKTQMNGSDSPVLSPGATKWWVRVAAAPHTCCCYDVG